SLSSSVLAGNETSNAATGTHQVCDNASNCATAGPISGNTMDKKAPQQNSCEGPDGSWHLSDVTLHCIYTDGGSGPASQTVNLTTNVANGTETSNAAASAGGTQACDAVSNCAASPANISGNKIDKKAPSVTCTAPNPSVWYGDNQSVNCAATDGGSGMSGATSAFLATTVADGTE